MINILNKGNLRLEGTIHSQRNCIRVFLVVLCVWVIYKLFIINQKHSILYIIDRSQHGKRNMHSHFYTGPNWCRKRVCEWLACMCGCLISPLFIVYWQTWCSVSFGTEHLIFDQCSEMYFCPPDPCCSHAHRLLHLPTLYHNLLYISLTYCSKL